MSLEVENYTQPHTWLSRMYVGGQEMRPFGCADTYNEDDVRTIEESIVKHVEYTLARSRYQFDDLEAYQATAYSLRDRLILLWNDTQQYFK